MAPVSALVAYLWLMVCLRLGEVSGQEHVKLTLGEQTEEYIVQCHEYQYFTVDAIDPCLDLRIKVNHVQGEPNVYVSRGPDQYPKLSSLVWSSYEWGSDTLTISSWDPEFVLGTYYIGVMAYCGTDVGTGSTPARFTVVAEHVTSTHPHDEILQNTGVSGNIVAEGYKYYRFCVTDSCATVNVTLKNCLDPAECPTSYSFPELLVSRSIETPTINSHAWKLAQFEYRSIVLNHDDPNFYPGHFFVGVYGWCTPDEYCSDLSTCGPCQYAANTEFSVTLDVTPVTGSCTPKQPLELCSADGASSLSSSILTLVLSSVSVYIVKSL